MTHLTAFLVEAFILNIIYLYFELFLRLQLLYTLIILIQLLTIIMEAPKFLICSSKLIRACERIFKNLQTNWAIPSKRFISCVRGRREGTATVIVTSALDGGKWSASGPNGFVLMGTTLHYSLNWRPFGTSCLCQGEGNNLTFPGIKPIYLVFQVAQSLYRLSNATQNMVAYF